MLRNYFKIAVRNLLRRKSYSILNIIGLSTGLACVIFILNWVKDETSFDRHFSKADRIYRLVSESGAGSDRWHQAVTNMAVGPEMSAMFPEIEEFTRIDKGNAMVINNTEQFIQDDIIFTDPAFFAMFDIDFIGGNAKAAINNPYQLVLTESTAAKYFDDENPIGKTLKIFAYDPEGRGEDYEITGVIPDPVPTSHLTYNMIASISTMDAAFPGSLSAWDNNSFYTYFQLVQGSSASALEGKFPLLIDHVRETTNTNLSHRYYLQPIESIHLNSDLLYEFKANGSMAYITVFSAIGIFILLLAGINYVNLSTSVTLERSKETGVRKVMGAYKSNLIGQQLMETLVLSIFAIVVAGLLVELFKTSFYDLTGKDHVAFGWYAVAFQLIAIGIPIAILAGLTPALFLARLETIKALKGTIDKNTRSGLRSALVFIQFTVTLIILVGLLVVRQQLNFVRSKDLGYDKTNLLTLSVHGDENIKLGFDAFKTDLLSNSGVSHVAKAGSIITSGLGNANGRVTQDGEERVVKIYRLPVGYDYINTYGMTLLSGKDFDPLMNIDSIQAFIINEQCATSFGWTPEEAVGQSLRYAGMSGTVIGVVKDFHFNSLHHTIEPLCMYVRNNFSRIVVKGNDSQRLLATVQYVWKQHYPAAIFDYQFQDQALFDSYHTDQRFGTIFEIFSALSMLIAFLGLFGLVGFSVAKRTKEIGIRKVLGASGTHVLYILSLNFIQIIALASLLGIPIAWYMMNEWLSDFPYRTNVQLWHFGLATLIILTVAVVIIFLQSIKPLQANPVDTLKEE